MENEKLNELLKGVFDSLTDEQKQKAAACKDTDGLLKMLSGEGVDLPDELLDAVAGGAIHYEYGGWAIIEDSTGRVLARTSDQAWNNWNAKGYVTYAALEMGQSNTEISDAELAALRAKNK